MKRVLVATAVLSLCLSANAEPWGHRYDEATQGQPWAIAVYTNGVSPALRMAYEWGRGGWDGAEGTQVGFGPNMTGAGWTWVNLDWFEDGDGQNKRTRASVTPTATGTNWYAYRFKATDINDGQYRYASGDANWSDKAANMDVASVASDLYHILVIPEPGMLLGGIVLLAMLVRRK